MKADWWVSSGLAADAAQELAWFVILVFIGIGVVMWLDMRKEEKDAQKQTVKGKTHKAN
jgi:UDP-N-acetylmuramyl pentapeptide phosphotransferase/UDP-N-acetylglucosamine-1-phosphate transferase